MHIRFSESSEGNLIANFATLVADYETTILVPSFEIDSIFRQHGRDWVITDLDELSIDHQVQLLTQIKEIKKAYETANNR